MHGDEPTKRTLNDGQGIFLLFIMAVKLKIHFWNHISYLFLRISHLIACYKFHLPSSNLSVYQKGVYFTGIKVFNNLPQSIKNLGNDFKMFKSELKNYLHAHSFYSLDEYFNVNRE
jgi:hypothetical protein